MHLGSAVGAPEYLPQGGTFAADLISDEGSTALLASKDHLGRHIPDPGLWMTFVTRIKLGGVTGRP